MTAPTTPSPERQPADAGGGPVWHRVDGNGATLLYTLRHKGFRRGVPVEVNDLEVRIQASAGSDSDPKPIIQRILAALEAPAPQAQPDARAVEALRRMERNPVSFSHAASQLARETLQSLSAPAADDGWRPSREEVAAIISGAPFPSKRAFAKADAILALHPAAPTDEVGKS